MEPVNDQEDAASWGDWDENDEAEQTKCLLTEEIFPSVDKAIDSCEGLGLKFRQNIKGKSTYDKMKIVNFIRMKAAEKESADSINKMIEKKEWSDDKYLTPTLEYDPLLFSLDEESDDGDEAATVDALRAENELLKEKLREYLEQEHQDPEPKKLPTVKEEDDRLFFSGYGQFDIHETMLKDIPRTALYRTALSENPTLVSGAKVLDLGCGTGILSMLAATGGASQVVGVDASERVAYFASENVKRNGLSGTIKIINNKIEDVVNPFGEGEKADVLVSEWMGYCLLFESMLDSVITARDTHLKPGGAILPDIARMFAAGIRYEGTDLQFWDKVWGYDMTAMRDEVQKQSLKTAVVTDISGSHVITSTSTIRTFDLSTVSKEEIPFTSDFTLKPFHGTESVSAVVLWFDTEFSPRYCKDQSVTLSTSPYAKPTHWHQTSLLLESPIAISKKSSSEGEIGSESRPATHISCTISIVKCQAHHRDLDISLTVTPFCGDDVGKTQTRSYIL